jgi:hypothetical protein
MTKTPEKRGCSVIAPNELYTSRELPKRASNSFTPHVKRCRAMRNRTRELLGVLTICLVVCSVGCGGSSCGSHLASPLTGSGGLTVALSGISNGSSVPCSGLSGGETCNFTADFSVAQLTQPVAGQLAVEVCTDADGGSFSSENPGQSPVFIQPGQVSLTPGTTGGSLQGTLGPPVGNKVRFALQVSFLDSSGQTVAVSDKVVNLAPE